MTPMERINLALRGLMELGIVAALATWGVNAGPGPASKALLGIGAPVLLFGFWGAVDFRRAALGEVLRLAQELLVSALAAAALYTAGHHALGWALVAASAVHHVLVYLLGGRLLPPGNPDRRASATAAARGP